VHAGRIVLFRFRFACGVGVLRFGGLCARMYDCSRVVRRMHAARSWIGRTILTYARAWTDKDTHAGCVAIRIRRHVRGGVAKQGAYVYVRP
jgi:hypothetical protein